MSEAERAIDVGTRILRLEPMHEAAVRRLMRLYGESGRRGAAIQLYRTLSEMLKTELNAEPEGETRAVLAEMSRGGDGQLETPAAVAAGSDAKSPPQPFTLAMLVIDHFVVSPSMTAAQPSTDVETTKAASFAQPGGISVAVLPFRNLSGDVGQEFFSDGITEEITAALAKVHDLQVVDRASAFQFKNEKKDMRLVGQALRARYLIDGSVRSAGTRVRITAQLIRADNGVNVWSESYDRELTDVFAIQEDIAKGGPAVAPLGFTARLRTSNLSTEQSLVQQRSRRMS